MFLVNLTVSNNLFGWDWWSVNIAKSNKKQNRDATVTLHWTHGHIMEKYYTVNMLLANAKSDGLGNSTWLLL